MTHPFKVLSWETPDLPADFHERRAYMQLSRAMDMHDSYWPSAAFGEEITILLERGHAEAHERGYRLTDAGRAFWQDFKRRYNKHSDAPLHETQEEVAS